MRSMRSYNDVFRSAVGAGPYPYQRRFAARRELPDVVIAPAGAGKTAAAVIGWLWRRRFHGQLARDRTPRRLVYCLPMRSLVEQSARTIVAWLRELQLADELPVHLMLGGAVEESWQEQPERDVILVGTQDQLLSRALNRGFAMSRYRWPVQFALLNNDCLWVLDEFHLMGVGASTSAQLQAFRDSLGTAKSTRSIWMSSMNAVGSLRTIDHDRSLRVLAFGASDLRVPALAARHRVRRASRSIRMATPTTLARHVLNVHRAGTLTLVVHNQVRRAQRLYLALLAVARDRVQIRLLHSRFRPPERRATEAEVFAAGWTGILIATQVIEAGNDLSARVVVTEVAPWPAMLQRVARCNRSGEHDGDDPCVYWIDRDLGAAPYRTADLLSSRRHVRELADLSPRSLASVAIDDVAPALPVIRRRDLIDLFDTNADLAGLDLDAFRWVRAGAERDVYVAWRELAKKPHANDPEPQRDELCRVPLDDVAVRLPQTRAYRWSADLGDWESVHAKRLVPGMTIVLPRDAGGYDALLGWTGEPEHVPAVLPIVGNRGEAADDEDLSLACDGYVTLSVHSSDVAREAGLLTATLGVAEARAEIERAARWHDLGKAHAVFQEMITSELDTHDPRREEVWAKSSGRTRPRYRRRAFRHELASALALLDCGGSDLEAFLVAAHHGKVRVSIRPRDGELVPGDGRAFALGVWQEDRLPATDLGDGVAVRATALDLSVTAFGDSDRGPSWVTRVARLVHQHGPFRLAYWEMLVRVADWRGTRLRRQAA